MKKALVCLLCLLFIPLGACRREKSLELAERVREHYAAEPALSLTAELRTDFGDRAIDFTLGYESAGDGSATLTVLAPDTIEGVTAHVENGGATLRYDDVTLELGALPGTGYSPLETLPFMLRQWAQGYATQTGFETIEGTGAFLVVYRSTQSGVVLEQKVLFDPESLAPLRCELSADGAVIVTCVFANPA